MRAHRVTRRPADAADLEARPTRHRRDDARESGPRGEREESGAGCADEHDCPEEIAPPVTYVLFAAFIILMKAATVYAMRGLKQAK